MRVFLPGVPPVPPPPRGGEPVRGPEDGLAVEDEGAESVWQQRHPRGGRPARAHGAHQRRLRAAAILAAGGHRLVSAASSRSPTVWLVSS